MGDSTANPYLRDAVLTATPEQLHLMLYDGAIRNATQAREAILRKDYETSYEKLTRAQHIILEMHNGLNFEINAELCGRMASVYNFLYKKLLDANVHHNVQDIDDSLRVLRIERETWQMLVDKVNRVRQQEGPEPSDTNANPPQPNAPRAMPHPTDEPNQAGLSVEG